jgi:glyoxylate/hydroxypyruvate reductase A
MINILFAAQPDQFPLYKDHLTHFLKKKNIPAYLSMELPPEIVDYIVYAPNSIITDLSSYTCCKAVLNLWAGVEKIVGNKTLTQPLCRMVDSGLQQGMIEWVAGHTLRYHLGMDKHLINPNKIWKNDPPPLAQDRSISILGLGVLGTACAKSLSQLGFKVNGWSTSPKKIPNVQTYHGNSNLKTVLNLADILILLLPDTPNTQNIINTETLSYLHKGSVLINPGRGPLIDDDALISALTSGRLSAACLDVFRSEPLPPNHPYWLMPNVTVTPHIASGTRAATAAEVIVENIVRGESGMPFLYLVDREAGY